MSEIRHIVFDIGNVLLRYDPELPYTRLIPEAAKRRWFLDNVCTSDWNVEQDRGRSWADAEALLIAEHPEHEENIRAFRGRWHEMVPHAFEDVAELMEGLIGKGHDVTMLTNFASDTFAEARERFEFLNKPRGVTVSAEVGLLKPQREIYDHHVSTFALEAPATLFIDDAEKNVAGAKAAGWQAVHFRDAATLANDLARLGVAV